MRPIFNRPANRPVSGRCEKFATPSARMPTRSGARQQKPAQQEEEAIGNGKGKTTDAHGRRSPWNLSDPCSRRLPTCPSLKDPHCAIDPQKSSDDYATEHVVAFEIETVVNDESEDGSFS